MEDDTEKTILPVEDDTKKHGSLDYLGGREAGWSEGVQAVLTKVEVELLRAGIGGAEKRRILERIRARTEEMD